MFSIIVHHYNLNSFLPTNCLLENLLVSSPGGGCNIGQNNRHIFNIDIRRKVRKFGDGVDGGRVEETGRRLVHRHA